MRRREMEKVEAMLMCVSLLLHRLIQNIRIKFDVKSSDGKLKSM
jgi:hypothetical protein